LKKPISREEVVEMGEGKKRRQKTESAKKHREYLREKKQKKKERRTKLQAPVKSKKK
jgi:hypothetical protein